MDVIGVAGDDNGRIFAGNFDGGELYEITNGAVSLMANTSGNINMIDADSEYIYIADPKNHRITSVAISDGTIEIFAGGSAGNLDGPRLKAQLNRPNAITKAKDGQSFYVLDLSLIHI